MSKPLTQSIDLTGKRWHTEWLTNARLNGILDPPIQSIHDLFFYDTYHDLIICGSGPSLTGDLARIKYRSDIDCLVIANHSNLATLFYHDIRPSYCMITDAGEGTLKRLRDDVLPNWPDACRNIDFILPTHMRTDLVQLLRSNGCEPFFFPQISQTTSVDVDKIDVAEQYNSILLTMTPSLKYIEDAQEITDCLTQSGCVSNASIIFSMFLKLHKAPLERVYLSGVDYSFPNGQNRCQNVTWNKALNEFDVINNPDRHEKDPPLLYLNGLATDPVQFEYYKDCRYIAQDIKVNEYFDLFTTTKNFLSDFLDVKAL